MLNKMCYNKSGFITLISTLVIGAVAVSVAVSLLLLGLGSSRTGFAQQQGNQAKALATACAEEAMQQIRNVAAYTGTANLTLTAGSCSYTVTSQGGQNRTITATGTVANIIRKVKIIINNITPNIQIASWQEVADF